MPFKRKVRVLCKTRLIFPRINGPNDVHKLADTPRAKINELDEFLNVIKTALENKRCDSYPRLVSESLEIRGKA